MDTFDRIVIKITLFFLAVSLYFSTSDTLKNTKEISQLKQTVAELQKKVSDEK